jgi:hypothetical protein
VLLVIGKITGVSLTSLAVELVLMGLIVTRVIAKPGSKPAIGGSSPTGEAIAALGFVDQWTLNRSGNPDRQTHPGHSTHKVGTGSSARNSGDMHASSLAVCRLDP